MSKLIKIGTIGLAAMMLSGCQSSFFSMLGFKSSKQSRAELAAAPDVNGAQLIEEGRAMLADGRLSAAVATFRLARLDASTAAQAENGLGVAYAKLGRADLADRYFRAAIARDPAESRFAANLLRLQRSVMLARAASPAPVEKVARLAEPEAQPLAAAPPVHRISDGMMRISTPEHLSERPRMSIAYVERAAPLSTAAADTPAPDQDAAQAAAEAETATAPKSKMVETPQ